MHQAILLVGHGGVPKDLPRSWLSELRRLVGERRARGSTEPAPRELELDRMIREHPRTAATDPYQAGIEAIAAELRPKLEGCRLAIAYNEFCAPSIAQAVRQLAEEGVRHVTVVPTMITPGGSHSEIDIPKALAALRAELELTIDYAWPFDVRGVAAFLAAHVSARTETLR
jgi:sirohydrochlorin cobaltochelatase